jgi:hypothetical protein
LRVYHAGDGSLVARAGQDALALLRLAAGFGKSPIGCDMAVAARATLPSLTAAAMTALAVLELVYFVGRIDTAGLLGRAAALLVTIAVMPRFGLREWALLGAALALTAGLAPRPDGWEAVRLALDRGAFFAAFILLMTLLREAAITSPAVLAMGNFLTRQQPGRRFLATYVGGHLAGVLLNFGAVSLLAPLVQRGVRAEPVLTAEDERRALIRERRALCALIRGFAMVITWAPTTLTQAIILHSLPGLSAARVMAYGLGISAVMLGVGWLEDRLRWGRPRSRAPGMPVVAFPGRAAGDLGIVALALTVGAYGARELLALSTAQALMLVAPCMLAGWVFAQNAGQGAGQGARAVGRRLREIAAGPLPRMTRDAFTLGAAGFIGTTAAALAPVDAIAAGLALESIPGWLFLIALPVIIIVTGTVAISPMMTVVFLGSVISALPVLPVDANLIALAFGAGWALALTAAPNATGAIFISGATGLPATTLTWRWNGVYSLAVLAVLAGVFWLVA